MHYYQHNLGDYQKKTQMLSMMEHGAYRLLLDNYYATHSPVPRDKSEAYRICRAITLAERKAVDAVLKRFFTETSDGFFHERCEKDIEEYIAKSLKAKENGSKGGVAAKEKRVANAIANATANGTANAVANGVANEQLTINHKPITNNQEENTNTPLTPLLGECDQSSSESKSASTPSEKSSVQCPAVASVRVPRAKSGSNYSEDFNRWFAAYPRQVAKGAAWKAWPSALAHFRARSKAATEEAAVEELINITVIYGLSPCCAVETEFVPHPATWLNQRRFEDDPKEWQRVSGGATVSGARSRVIASGPGQIAPGDDDPFARG